jgi:hypothetical protein
MALLLKTKRFMILIIEHYLFGRFLKNKKT